MKTLSSQTLLCRLPLIGVTILSSSVWAQEKRPMNIVDVLNVPDRRRENSASG